MQEGLSTFLTIIGWSLALIFFYLLATNADKLNPLLKTGGDITNTTFKTLQGR